VDNANTLRIFDKILGFSFRVRLILMFWRSVYWICSFIVLKIVEIAVLRWGLNLLLLWQGWWYRKGMV